ncbi:disintegrin and metalloproteinase domain-containing protein 8-like [Megalops cyprinoides]|uniref:disintegrin and metalloproteinase domain-containing protein 8-like n=1 Tax=Megalops cyprinoides TaxID=118141 RepID=UPI00186511E2|nr:disintegrin and metalloproteinase domain-containing protein 8-like [Megalops cyprinoides]
MRYISSVLIFTFISSCGSLIRSVRSLPGVTDYEVVRPLKLSSRAKRSISSEQTYPEELQYALTIEGKNYTVHLEKNSLLIGEHYTETHYLENGTEVTTSPNYEDHCYYHGYIQDFEDSSVSIGMCSGIRGFLRAEQQVYLIEPLEDSVEGDHAVYRQEHLRSKTGTCGNSNDTSYDYEPFLSELYKPLMSESLMSGKARFVEMFLVVDHSEYIYLGRNMESIKARMLEITNHVDKLYRPLNIRVMLVGLEVWSYQDKINVSVNANETLTRFLQWRQDSLIKKTKHDNAQFITAVDFSGDTVGLAPMYAMCTANSGAVSQDGVINPIRIASIITHEMGHNLGMDHDNDLYCDCSASVYQKCIMEPSLGLFYPRKFSSCSKNNLGEFLENSNPSCLLNHPAPEKLVGGPVCGNAFLEPGEECDCGTLQECKNPCCDATTCRLKKGAKCAEGECCRNCQLKQAGSPCRESANDCDLAEYCTGQSAQCPKDVFKMNGLPCNFDQGYCYNGQCPTYLHHCRKLWGSGAQVASELCFYFNTFKSTNAYCKKTQSGYQPCTAWNRKCGKIFCTGGKPFPITLKMVALIDGKCNIAVDSSETEDLGMVPTGTKCGDEKVCYNNICQSFTIYGVGDCSAKCNYRGVCNHERQCHCDPGWAPPYCDVKYDDFNSVTPGVTQGRNLRLVLNSSSI